MLGCALVMPRAPTPDKKPIEHSDHYQEPCDKQVSHEDEDESSQKDEDRSPCSEFLKPESGPSRFFGHDS